MRKFQIKNLPMTNYFSIEERFSSKISIIGADETGYGSVAGPLFVCAVKAPKDWNLTGLNDSKKLSPKKRGIMLLKLTELIKNREISYHLAERSNTDIDQYGVYTVLKQAYIECFQKLYDSQSLIITDGNLKFDNLGVNDYDKISIVKADSKYPTVMAASIIAKEWRDDKMHQLHANYPNYNWLKNAGYPTYEHLAAIKKCGYSPLHRLSYNFKS